MSVTGWPVGTFVRGRKVMWQGELVGAVAGRGGAVPGDDGTRHLRSNFSPTFSCYFSRPISTLRRRASMFGHAREASIPAKGGQPECMHFACHDGLMTDGFSLIENC